MLKAEDFTAKQGDQGEVISDWSQICVNCRSAACTVYCREELAYLCGACDIRIHAANQLASAHQRVWICEACERAPAAFLCKADSASLCAACDWDIHSANPLARRHHRVPVLPIDTLNYPAAGLKMGCVKDEFLTENSDENADEEDEEEAASWLLLNPVRSCEEQSIDLFAGEIDEYLGVDDYNSYPNIEFNDHQQQFIVARKSKDQVQDACFELGLQHTAMNAEYDYCASMSHSVSLSTLDAGIVPESRMNEVSMFHSRTPKGTIDLFSSPPIQVPTQLTPMDREARVLRYKEKKKSRKFEKTIRYASRKAYAETRPRIKGRFAKRKVTEIQVDRMFSASLLAESEYGIVPSF